MKSVLRINNLRCGGCANTISNQLLKNAEVEKVEVSHEDSSVTVEHLESISVDALAEQLAKIGYPLVGDENSILTKAKGLKSCMIGKLS